MDIYQKGDNPILLNSFIYNSSSNIYDIDNFNLNSSILSNSTKLTLNSISYDNINIIPYFIT